MREIPPDQWVIKEDKKSDAIRVTLNPGPYRVHFNLDSLKLPRDLRLAISKERNRRFKPIVRDDEMPF
jgi:hypothetical protein